MVMKLRYRNKYCEVMLGPNKFWIWTTSKNFAQISHKLCKIRWKDVFFFLTRNNSPSYSFKKATFRCKAWHLDKCLLHLWNLSC